MGYGKRNRELYEALHHAILPELLHQCGFEQERDPVYKSLDEDAIFLRHPVLPYLLTSVSFFDDPYSGASKISFHTRVQITGGRDEEHSIRFGSTVLRYMVEDIHLLVAEAVRCGSGVLQALKGLRAVIEALPEDLPRHAADPSSTEAQVLIATRRLMDPAWLPHFMPRMFPEHLRIHLKSPR